jgi:hypothetical protein
VTFARRPSFQGGTAARVCIISDFRKEEYFSFRDWTTQITLNLLAKFVFSRTRFRAFRAGQKRRTSGKIELICLDGGKSVELAISVGRNNWRLANAGRGSVIDPARTLSSAPAGKAGRNELCPCGSGKKYKKRCGLN